MSFPLLPQEANTEERSQIKISQAQEFHAQTQTCYVAGQERAAQQVLMDRWKTSWNCPKIPTVPLPQMLFPQQDALLKTD